MMMTKQTNIGFIGIGVMGASMAGHLLKAGYTLHIFTRSKHKAEPLISQGAIWHDDVAFLAIQSDFIFTIVGYPEDVRSIYLAENGIIKHAKRGSYLVDMTTSSPSLAHEIYQEASKHQRMPDAKGKPAVPARLWDYIRHELSKQRSTASDML